MEASPRDVVYTLDADCSSAEPFQLACEPRSFHFATSFIHVITCCGEYGHSTIADGLKLARKGISCLFVVSGAAKGHDKKEGVLLGVHGGLRAAIINQEGVSLD